MLFTINDLGFSIAGLLLEGWLAFAARCVCALALLFIGWVDKPGPGVSALGSAAAGCKKASSPAC